MKKLSVLTTRSSLLGLVLLAGCQELRLSQQASGAVDRARVAATLDKFQLVTDDSAEAFFNLSVAEMEVFNALRCERQLRQLEREPFAYRTVFFDTRGREVGAYDPEGRVEERRVRLTGEAFLRQQAEVERGCRWVEEMHRLSVERYGVSWNAISGEQLDALGDELPY